MLRKVICDSFSMMFSCMSRKQSLPSLHVRQFKVHSSAYVMASGILRLIATQRRMLTSVKRTTLRRQVMIWKVVELSRPVEISSRNKVFLAATSISPASTSAAGSCTPFFCGHQCCTCRWIATNRSNYAAAPEHSTWLHLSRSHGASLAHGLRCDNLQKQHPGCDPSKTCNLSFPATPFFSEGAIGDGLPQG